MLTLVDSLMLSFPANRPDLGCAMLMASCKAWGIHTTLVTGQTRLIRDIFVNNADELRDLVLGMDPLKVSDPVTAEFLDYGSGKDRQGFKDNLSRLYQAVFTANDPRRFLNAGETRDAWRVLKGAIAVYTHYIKVLKRTDLSVVKNCVDQIAASNPQMAAFSLQARFDPITCAIMETVKTRLGIPIVAGGTVTPFIPESKYAGILRDYPVDYLIIGAGDRALPQLAEAVATGGDLRQITNLVYQSGAEVRINPLAALDRLDELPFPDYSQFDLDSYLSPVRILPIQTARGCTWRKCGFCQHSTIYGEKYETLSIPRVVAMIRHLRDRYDCRHFAVHDDEIPPGRMRRIARALAGETLTDCSFHILARLDRGYDDPALLTEMRRVGVSSVMWGLESGSQKVVDLMNKGIHMKTVERILRKSTRAGIFNLCFIMFGFPGETLGDSAESIAFLEKNKAYIYSVFSGVFILGRCSPIYKNPEKWGITIKEGRDYTVSRGMDRETARKRLAEFKAKDEFNYSIVNPDRFQNFSPGNFTSHMVLFLLSAHNLLCREETLQRLSDERLDMLYPMLLGEIRLSAGRPVLTRLDITRPLAVNLLFAKQRRTLSSVEAGMARQADGSRSLGAIIDILGPAGEERGNCLAFIREMVEKKQCLAFGRSWQQLEKNEAFV